MAGQARSETSAVATAVVETAPARSAEVAPSFAATPEPAPEPAPAPLSVSFYQALRRIECAHPERPRIGEASTPGEEPLRLGQEPTLAFRANPLSAMKWVDEAGVLRVRVNFFGAFGANGPLPLHLTEYAHQRAHNQRDATFSAFVDVFHHRLLSLFYRAWANAQPAANLDRPSEDRFGRYVGCLAGLGDLSQSTRRTELEHFTLYAAGHFVTRARHPEGLSKLIRGFFQVPVRIEEFVGDALQIPDEYRWRLGAPPVDGIVLGKLGESSRLGSEVWERQAKFRIVLGPLNRLEHDQFLPGSARLEQLTKLVERYVGKELAWDLRLELCAPDRHPTVLGVTGVLGQTSYIGERNLDDDKNWQDLIFAPLNTGN